MRTRWFFLVGAVLATLGLLAIFIFMIARSSPARIDSSPEVAEDPGQAGIKIMARRVISPSRGIDTPLAILGDGEQVLVTGHGNCNPGEESYVIRVTVTQNGIKAKGETSGDCVNGSPTWEAIATTLGPTLFEPGPAQVCAMAVVKLEAGPALVEKWCKEDVELILLE